MEDEQEPVNQVDCTAEVPRSWSQPVIRVSLRDMLSTSFRLPQSSENLQEICKIKNLDTGETVDLNDLQQPSFDTSLQGLTQMDCAEVTDFM